MRTCFLSSQMNAIGGFSAPLNGVRPGYPAKMITHQKQETPRTGLSGTHYSTDVENSAARHSSEAALGLKIGPLLAPGEPRVLPLVQFCQIRQAVHRELLGIALASRRKGFNISANFLP